MIRNPGVGRSYEKAAPSAPKAPRVEVKIPKGATDHMLVKIPNQRGKY